MKGKGKGKGEGKGALALRQSDWRNCGLSVGLYAESGITLLVGIW